MTNKCNITLNEKDIRIKPMVQHKAPVWINSFPLDGIDDETNSKLLKQQILDNQEIVQRMKELVKSMSELGDNKKHREDKPFCKTCMEYDIIKAILEKQA